MILRSSYIALGATLLLNSSIVCGLSSSEIPHDTPISSLVSSAKAHLAQGNANDALTYFDVAISRDPRNYLTIFQRGATYLSLGKSAKASDDFDRVLSIKPGFEGALVQRAKIKSRVADWEGAKSDYKAAGKEHSPDFAELEQAQGAASVALDAEKAQDWEGCVTQAGAAIMIASTALSLRQLRAKCRFERGEIREGASDLQRVLMLSPKSIEPHLRISSSLFYALGDIEKGMAQIRSCLHSDPDSKPCAKLYRREKTLDKALKKVNEMKQKRQFNSAANLLVGSGEDTGLIDGIKEDIKIAKTSGAIHKNSPNDLVNSLVEMTCEIYGEVRSKHVIHSFLNAQC